MRKVARKIDRWLHSEFDILGGVLLGLIFSAALWGAILL